MYWREWREDYYFATVSHAAQSVVVYSTQPLVESTFEKKIPNLPLGPYLLTGPDAKNYLRMMERLTKLRTKEGLPQIRILKVLALNEQGEIIGSFSLYAAAYEYTNLAWVGLLMTPYIQGKIATRLEQTEYLEQDKKNNYWYTSRDFRM